VHYRSPPLPRFWFLFLPPTTGSGSPLLVVLRTTVPYRSTCCRFTTGLPFPRSVRFGSSPWFYLPGFLVPATDSGFLDATFSGYTFRSFWLDSSFVPAIRYYVPAPFTTVTSLPHCVATTFRIFTVHAHYGSGSVLDYRFGSAVSTPATVHSCHHLVLPPTLPADSGPFPFTTTPLRSDSTTRSHTGYTTVWFYTHMHHTTTTCHFYHYHSLVLVLLVPPPPLQLFYHTTSYLPVLHYTTLFYLRLVPTATLPRSLVGKFTTFVLPLQIVRSTFTFYIHLRLHHVPTVRLRSTTTPFTTTYRWFCYTVTTAASPFHSSYTYWITHLWFYMGSLPTAPLLVSGSHTTTTTSSHGLPPPHSPAHAYTTPSPASACTCGCYTLPGSARHHLLPFCWF